MNSDPILVFMSAVPIILMFSVMGVVCLQILNSFNNREDKKITFEAFVKKRYRDFFNFQKQRDKELEEFYR